MRSSVKVSLPTFRKIRIVLIRYAKLGESFFAYFLFERKKVLRRRKKINSHCTNGYAKLNESFFAHFL